MDTPLVLNLSSNYNPAFQPFVYSQMYFFKTYILHCIMMCYRMSDTSVASPSDEYNKLTTYGYEEQLSSPSSSLRFSCQKNNQVRVNFACTNTCMCNFILIKLTLSSQVGTVVLYGVPIVSLIIDSQERLCLGQISNTLLKNFSYNFLKFSGSRIFT